MYKIYTAGDKYELFLNDEFIADGFCFSDFKDLIPDGSQVRIYNF